MPTCPIARVRSVSLVSAIALATVPLSVRAQDDGDAESASEATQGNTIIVTAQRRAQELQDVPAAVTALTGAALENRQIADTNDLQNQIPNVVISTGTGTANSARIYFRGVGEDESRGAIDPAVGIYIDDVYLGRTVGSLVDLVDIAQVEVLRGPQGTLYGRNTNGGAIKITSVRPDLGDTSFTGEVGYGNYDRIQARGSLNLAAWDSGAIRISGLYRQRDGYFELNPNGAFANLAGTTIGDEEVFAVRGSLYGEMSDIWSFLAIVDYTKDKSDPVPSSIIADSDNPTVITDADDDIFTVEPQPGVTCSALTPSTFVPLGCFSAFSSEVDSFGVSYQLKGDYDGFSITSTTAYRTLKDDLSTHITFPYFQETDQNQFSQEILVNTNFGMVDLTAGAFYYSEDAELAFTFILPVTNDVETESFSLFGQAAISLTDALTLTGGLRWTDESRDFRGTSVVIPVVTDSVSTDNITWTAKVDYKITPDVMVYATYSTGFKSPGFSSDCFSPAGCFLSVEEEELDSIEAGLRTQFMDGRATFNATYFYNDYTNLQISATTGGGVFTRSNAGEARIQGVELEFGFEPVPGLDIYGNASWLDAEYRNLSPLQAGTLTNSNINTGARGPACTGITAVGPSAAFNDQVVECALGLELKNAPEWKGLLGFNYSFPVGAGEVFFGADGAYESDSFALVANPPGSLVEPGFRVDARAGWRSEDNRWKVTLWGKNLTDREYFRASTALNQVYAAPPLTFGVDVGFRFD
ncbi:TonB-dependent receptor [Altererythrobacter arenosus]|uniref:TonB-dependent receptor n=1 Tax=Altererythrobacter arenosus TaxID=3032592 RepID=A0ABY8FMV5_9SPHN|nr:TonB-dependent receptor [Altererythrobacter sp. CAU 1644]WFL76364.1 TonB-dependent receptor [Altererythrobacter sp. CAU 1644]